MDKTTQDKNIQLKKRLFGITLLILFVISGLFLYIDYKTQLRSFKNDIKTVKISSFFRFKGKATAMQMNKTKEVLFLSTSDGLWILSLIEEKDLEVLSVLKSKDKAFSKISTILLSADERRLYLQGKSKIVVVDISNIKEPHILSFMDIGVSEVQSINMSIDKKKIYICADATLFVLDIQNRDRLKFNKESLTGFYKEFFEVKKGVFYAVDTNYNLDILTNDGGEMRLLGSYSLIDIPKNFIFSEGKRRLYFLNEKGIEILNIEDVTDPKPFGSFKLFHLISHLAELSHNGNYLYLPQQKGYLDIFDVHYTDSIKKIARIDYGNKALQAVSCLLSKDSKYLYILFKNTHIGIVKLVQKGGSGIYER